MSQPIDTAYVEVRPDLDKFAAQLAARLSASLNKLQANVDRSLRRTSTHAGAEGERAGRAFGDNFTRDAKRGVDRIKSSITNAVAGLSTLGRGAVGVTALAGAAGGGAAALAGLASAAAGALPIIAGLAATIGTASGALLALPGAAALGLTATSTLRVGLIGVGDAMKAVAEGDATKLAEALQDLAPNAQQFVRQLNSLKPAFDQLRLDVQNTLFAGLADRLKTLSASILPTVQTGMTSVAGVLNGQLRAGFAELSSANSRIRLDAIFHNGRRALDGLTVAVQPLIQALLDVSAVGSAVVADLSAGFGGFVADLSDRLSELVASGQFRQIIDDGLATLAQLGAAASDVFGIVSGIFNAAGAAGGGGGLFTLLDQLNETVNSIAGQQALSAIFTELSRVGAALAPVLLAVAEGLGPVARGVANIATAFGPVLTGLAQQLGPALASLAPAIISLAPAVAALGGALQPLADIISGLVTSAAPGITRFIEGLVEGLKALAPAAGPVGRALGDLLAAAAPLLEVVGAQLANVLTVVATALSTVAREAQPLIEVWGDALAGAARELLPPLLQLAEGVLPLAARLGAEMAEGFRPLVPVIVELARQFAGQLSQMLPQFVEVLQELVPVVSQVAQSLGEYLLTAIESIMPHLPALVQGGLDLVLALLGLYTAVAPLIPVVVEVATALAGLLVKSGVLQAGLLVLTTAVKAVAVGARFLTEGIKVVGSAFGTVTGAAGKLASAIGEKVKGAVDAVKGVGKKIKDGVGDLGRTLFSAGAAVISGLISGIESKLGPLGTALGKVGEFIQDHKGPIEKDRRLLIPAADAIMGSFIKRLGEHHRGSLLAALQGMTEDVQAAYAGAAALDRLRAGSTSATTVPGGAAAPQVVVQPAPAPVSAPVFDVFIQVGDGPVERVAARIYARESTAQARALTYQPRMV